MAKAPVNRARIIGDVIDQIVLDPLDGLSVGTNSGEVTASPESPPAGGMNRPQEAAASFLQNAPHSVDPTVEQESETGETLYVERSSLATICRIGNRKYRVSGAKTIFVTSLRVNVRATMEDDAGNSCGASHYDTLDLYSSRARSSFALSLSRLWGSEATRIEKDLVLILERLEKERDDELARMGEKREHVVTEEERKRGLELLEDPDLFTRIIEDLSSLGYVGEDINKQLLYLCASSRKLDDPISVLILSQSASGKSYLVDCVRRLMPVEDVVAVTSLSDQALNYIDDLSHKFLILGEAVHSEVIEHQIREMLSGKELSRLVTIKDAETGKMQSRIVRTPVIVSSVMSGTSYAVNPENSSRCFVVNTDESQEQTEKIHESQRHKYSLERLTAGKNMVEEIVARHQAAQRLLRKVNIVNDFAPFLDFPSTLMRLRRDHDRFLDLIACVCFLRQYQKDVEKAKGIEFIRCDLEDYRVAYRIMVQGVLSSTVRELPKSALSLYDAIRAWVKSESKKQAVSLIELSFSQRQIREATGLGHTWVKNNMRLLADYEYVVFTRGGQERSKALYRLKDDAEIGGADLSMIPTPDEMAAKIGRASR